MLRFVDGENVTVAVERGTAAIDSATGQQTVTYAAVAGMTAIMAAVQHMSSTRALTVLGVLTGEAWEFAVDAEQVAVGSFFAEGDRLKRSDTGETFTVTQARLVGPGRGILWQLTTQRKTA